MTSSLSDMDSKYKQKLQQEEPAAPIAHTSRNIPLTAPSPFQAPSSPSHNSHVLPGAYPLSSHSSSSSCSRADYKAHKRQLKTEAKCSKREAHALVKEAKHQAKEFKHEAKHQAKQFKREVKHQAKDFKRELKHQTLEAIKTVRSQMSEEEQAQMDQEAACEQCRQQQQQRPRERGCRQHHHHKHHHHHSHHRNQYPSSHVRFFGFRLATRLLERSLRFLESHDDSSRRIEYEHQTSSPVILVRPAPLVDTASLPPPPPPMQAQAPATPFTEKPIGAQEPMLVYAMANTSLNAHRPSSSVTPQASAPRFDLEHEEVPPPPYQASIAK